MKLTFIGTGGGRYVMIDQLRSTAGFQLEIDKTCIHFDPGPGTLLRYKQMGLRPSGLDGIIVSHIHTEHCVEAGALIEGMTYGGRTKRGFVITNKTFSESINPYYKKLPKDFLILTPGNEVDLGVRIKAIRCTHGDPETLGFLIKGNEGSFYYTSDTGLLEEQKKIQADVVVANLTALKGDGRMGIPEVAELAKVIHPKKLILTHFGRKVLSYGPERIAKEIRDSTGVDVMAVRDGQIVDIELKQTALGTFK